VTDREITSLVREGVSDVDAIGRYCGAGTGCGGCRSEIERLVDAGQQRPAEVAEVAHASDGPVGVAQLVEIGRPRSVAGARSAG
jgi:bacterioferritin-associated ferredoxin